MQVLHTDQVRTTTILIDTNANTMTVELASAQAIRLATEIIRHQVGQDLTADITNLIGRGRGQLSSQTQPCAHQPPGPYSRELVKLARRSDPMLDVIVKGANAATVAQAMRDVVAAYATKPRPWDLRAHIIRRLVRDYQASLGPGWGRTEALLPWSDQNWPSVAINGHQEKSHTKQP